MVKKKILSLLIGIVITMPSFASASIIPPLQNNNNSVDKIIKPVEVTAKIDEYGEVILKWDAKEGTEYIVKKTDKKNHTQTIAKTRNGKVKDICRHKGTYKYSVLPIYGSMPISAPAIRYLTAGSKNKNLDLKISGRNIEIIGDTIKKADGFELLVDGKKKIIKKTKFKALGPLETTACYKIRAFRKDNKTGKKLYTGKITRYVYISDYDPDLAIEYAEKYSENYNPEYRDYNPQGGDCANFVSQCLSAGGMSQNEEWNYYNDRGSAAWINVRSMYELFSKKYEVIEYPEYDDFEKGDIVMKKTLHHVVICSGRNEEGVPLIYAHNDSHSNDPLYGSISDWLLIKPTCGAISKKPIEPPLIQQENSEEEIQY